MELAYYPGCSLRSSSAIYDHQTKLVLEELGIRLAEIPDWSCCGATSAGKTDDFLAIAMPARNLGIVDEMEQSEMVIPCSACYSKTIVAQKCLESDPEMKEQINLDLEKKVKGNTKISTILEVLTSMVDSGKLYKKVKKKLQGLSPACYYGCMLTRFPLDVPVPDDVENPQGMEKILRALGAKTLDWSYKTDCCGASAAVNDQDTAFNLMARIMKDAVARGAACFVTTCPMCQMNLDAYQDKFCQEHDIGERLPVYFITEMIGLALGFSPKELEIDRHFMESISLLKELNLV